MILQGDAYTQLQTMPAESIDCMITSPPYWNLRNYGVDGQLGLEQDYKTYIEKLMKIMSEVKRVLKPTGSAWVNLGDTYSGCGGGGCSQGPDRKGGVDHHKGRDKPPQSKYRSVMGKSQIGIPQRFYVAMIDDGWLARNYIIWRKPNPMPASVKDRLNVTYEPVMFFTKQKKYYFNLDSIREKSQTAKKPEWMERKRQGIQSTLDNKQPHTNQERKSTDIPGQTTQTISSQHTGYYDKDTGEPMSHPLWKNPGDVWDITLRPFADAHFATFPPELPEKIIKCACPQGGVVLDPFFGAGTTALAALKLGRKYIGIELNAEYIGIAEKRLAPYQNQTLEVTR